MAEEHKEETSKGLKEETKVNFSISNNSSPVSHVSLEDDEQEIDIGAESGEDEYGMIVSGTQFKSCLATTTATSCE